MEGVDWERGVLNRREMVLVGDKGLFVRQVVGCYLIGLSW